MLGAGVILHFNEIISVIHLTCRCCGWWVYFYLVLKCVPSYQGLESTDMFSTRCGRPSICQKTMGESLFLKKKKNTILGKYDCHGLLFPFHFFLTSIHPLSWLSVLCMPVQHSRVSPGEQTQTQGYGAVTQSPLSLLLSPTLSPTVSLPISPISLPYDCIADKTRGPHSAQLLVPALSSHTKSVPLCHRCYGWSKAAALLSKDQIL